MDRGPALGHIQGLEVTVRTAHLEALPALLADLDRLRLIGYSRMLQPATPSPENGNRPQQASERLLSPEDVAKKLGVKIRWVYENQEKIPGRKKLGRHLRFSERRLDIWIKSGSSG